MKKKKKQIKSLRFVFLFLILFSILIFLLSPTSSFAQQQNDFGIVVFPARQEIDVKPGEEKTIGVSFVNQTLFPITGILKKTDFIVKDDENTPFFIEDTIPSNKYSASSWINLPSKNIAIPAYDKTIIYFKLKVPKNASPGGHYAAIFIEGTPSTPKASSDKEGTAVIAPRAGALLYIKVAGKIKEKAIISKFIAPNFSEYGPIKVETSILNQGNIHITPKGKIELYDIFGKLVDEDKLKEKNIFPETLTKYENKLGKKWMFGRYKLILTASYGTKGQGLKAQRTIYVFPYRLIAVIVLSLFIIFYLIYHFYSLTIKRQKLLEEKLEEEKKKIERLKKIISRREE